MADSKTTRQRGIRADRQITEQPAARRKGRVLFVGQSYYHTWYLSRALRQLGWKADVLNWDTDPASQMYYHGQDYRLAPHGVHRHLWFYLKSLLRYDIFHFSNAHCMVFGYRLHKLVKKVFPAYAEIRLLKHLGKKIVYSNNGCYDGVAQSSFRTWGPEPVCDSCRWRDVPEVCSDERNLAWGAIRNELADIQCTVGGNRKDYNDDPRVLEVPQFYCLDPNVWSPDLLIPTNYRIPLPSSTVKILHAVGNFESRTQAASQRNIKSTHIYLPVIDRLKREGHNVELIFFHDVPNKQFRFYQAQADIVADMLTFGWFGANVREALMLGKPAVCFLRPEWLQSVREQLPQYVEELPVVNATPGTVYQVLKDLVQNEEKRRRIGQRSRQFALKWHSAEAGARRMDEIYSKLLEHHRAAA